MHPCGLHKQTYAGCRLHKLTCAVGRAQVNICKLDALSALDTDRASVERKKAVGCTKEHTCVTPSGSLPQPWFGSSRLFRQPLTTEQARLLFLPPLYGKSLTKTTLSIQSCSREGHPYDCSTPDRLATFACPVASLSLTQVISHQEPIAYTMCSLWAICLVRVSHPHDLQHVR